MVLNQRCTGLLFVFYICVCKLTAAAVDRVRLRDVEVLTLYNGKMTNGRRSSPVPQLKCVGRGTAGCSAFTPNVVQCYNRGWDGHDAQWECKTDMDNKYRFGHIEVNCEGYEYPDDPYILQGSCGLEYSIDMTEEGHQKQRSSGHGHRNNYHHGNGYNRRSMNSYGFGDLVMLVIVGGIIYMIYSTCTGNRDRGAAPPPYAEEADLRRDHTQGPDTPPPPYNNPDEPGFKRQYTTQGSAPPPTHTEQPGFRSEYAQGSTGTTSSGTSAGTSNYGFWSGAATGGLLSYLFSRFTGGNRYYQNGYGGGWGSSYNSNPYYGNTGAGWFGGRSSYSHRPSNHGFSSFGSSYSSSGGSSGGSRTASGIGGTSRR